MLLQRLTLFYELCSQSHTLVGDAKVSAICEPCYNIQHNVVCCSNQLLLQALSSPQICLWVCSMLDR